MGAFDRLRLWNRVRVAINQVFRENDPAAVERLLCQDPAASKGVARRAMAMSEVFPFHALLLAIGLARCEAPEAVDLVRWFADREFGWDRLEEKALRDLRRHLVDRGETGLLDSVRERLNERQFAWLLPDMSAGDFPAEFARLQEEDALRKAVQCIAGFIEEAGLHAQPAGQGLDNAAAVATILWDRGRAEEALQLWTLLAIAEPQRFEDPACLRPVANALPGWIPCPELASIEDFPRAQVDTSVPPRVVRAADLLADFPHVDWIEPLRRAWLATDDLVRRDGRDAQHERNPQRLMAAQSIAAALGACAALDQQMRLLVRDETGRRHRHDALGRQLERRNHLVGKYNQLIAGYHAGKDAVGAIRKQRDEIGKLDDMIARARAALREELTPAAHLLHTISDGQAYPVEVRQGAAWGLHRIVENGALEEIDRDRARKTLHAVLHDQEFDESALRSRISAVLPDTDVRVRKLLVAAERYAADRDAEELTATVRRLAPEAPSLAKELRDGVDTSLQSRGRGDFGERVLRLLPGARRLELVGTLRRGLRWMVEIIEARAGRDPSLEANLPCLAALVGEHLPGVMDFLSRYPLRLMTLQRHREILGQYSREKAHLQFWTRYTPPRWFRGANPREIGEVHRRYLNLDDRSMPNALGLYYRLFEHPALVLPVLYHEFLHYGGPKGNPKHGIENETEVLMREVFFARDLLARLAPANDDQLPVYEAALAEAIERTELLGLARQLFFEFEDDDFLVAINDHIAQTYGEGLDADAAMSEIDKQMEHWNRTIKLENQIDEAKRSWCPEINWPQLGVAETRDLTDRFRAILSRTLQQNHRLSVARRDEVLSEPVCRRHRDAWFAYRRRPAAFAELSRRFAQGGLDLPALRVIAQRFELDAPLASVSDVLRLLSAFSGRQTA